MLFHRPADADGGLRGVSVTFVALAIGVPLGAAADARRPSGAGAIGRWVPAHAGDHRGRAGRAWPCRSGHRPLVAAAFLLGFGGQAVKVSVDSAVQRTVDDEHRGLVFALYDVLFNVAFVAAVALDRVRWPRSTGARLALVVFAAAILVAAGLWYRRVTPPRMASPVRQAPSRPRPTRRLGPAHQASSSASAVAASDRAALQPAVEQEAVGLARPSGPGGSPAAP